ncbi:MAG: 4Fe-4S binding protein [Chloroflexi bacterium]|nr:4Fe-4S binding protein [Chloroflexota bacterium]MBU1750757.1 4Fe-4S binding protein [Chloroflexota bacterium]
MPETTQALTDELARVIAQTLTQDDIAGVLAPRRNGTGAAAPYLFTPGEEVTGLSLSPWYHLLNAVTHIQKAHPEARLGVVVRGCDQRGLVELAKRKQVDLDRLVLIGLACTAEEAQECGCDQPAPAHVDVGAAPAPAANPIVEEFLKKSLAERRAFWQQQFAKCIKCYGCRDTCPQCFCEECALGESYWVETGELPPPFPIFHLIRAMHTVGKCVGCGACEDACPAGIPLTILYDLMRAELQEQTGYEVGRSVDEPPPLGTEEYGGKMSY